MVRHKWTPGKQLSSTLQANDRQVRFVQLAAVTAAQYVRLLRAWALISCQTRRVPG
jgi:hypothetical protein